MTVDQIEELIRKYLSTGIAVVIVLIGPATATSGATPAPQVITVTPDPSTSARPAAAGPTATDGATAPGSATAGAAVTSASASASRSPDVPSATDTVAPTTDGYPDSTAAEETPTTAGTPTKDKHEDKHRHDTNPTNPTNPTDPTDTATATPPTAAAPTGSDSADSPDATGSPPTAAPSARTQAGEGTTAAATLGWGTPTRQDDFTGDLAGWGVYDGPGHAGKGIRSPSAATVSNGVLTITGDARGTTGGLDWGEGQKYGRWEGRVKAPASDPSYDAVMLLWPDAEDFPQGGEVDFVEMTDPTRQATNLFVHHGTDNAQVHGNVEVDATQFHNWAVEWTPKAITAFVDGKQWWHSDDPSIQPPGPMHLCLQLDWFPGNAQGAVRPSQMQVEWVRQYAGDSAGPTAAAKPAADTGTGDGRGSVMRAVIQRMFGW